MDAEITRFMLRVNDTGMSGQFVDCDRNTISAPGDFIIFCWWLWYMCCLIRYILNSIIYIFILVARTELQGFSTGSKYNTILNPKGYNMARVLKASGVPMLAIDRGVYVARKSNNQYT